METIDDLRRSLPSCPTACTENEHTSASILCHGCMEPYLYVSKVVCPQCNVIQYCSKDCQQNDCVEGGGHSSFQCHFIQSIFKIHNGINTNNMSTGKGVRIQIATDEESFPEYLVISPEMCSKPTKDSAAKYPNKAPKMIDVKPTGKQIQCSIGDQGTIILFPHEFDSAGSFFNSIRITDRS